MLFLGQRMGEGLLNIMTQQFQLKREVIFDKASPVIYFEQVMLDGLWLIFPLVLPLVIVALFTPIMMGGWNFTLEAMAPKFSKMNPLSGLKRMFGIQGLIELLKSIIKITLVFLVAGMLFDMNFADFMGLSDLDVNQSVAKAVHMVGMSALLLSASLLLVVAIDVPSQIWNVKRQLMMTKQEIKDESKEQEGNPEVKGQIRRKQMEMSQRRMMDEVPKADVVVTNPNHFAVALKYDPQGAGAPVVVAKGIDFIAAQIRNIAVSSGVTLVAAPPLARALYYSTDLEQEIPRGLYVAVAQVLAYVFQLKQASENGWERPKPPVNLDVPEQFRQY